MIGRTISHYQVLSKLGEGGMGVVYKAEDTKLHRTVALKFLPPHWVEPARKQRFLQEARSAARLQHPNICPVYEVDETDGQLFFAMACLEGKTLAERLAAGVLAVDEALEIAIQVARGLEEAHRQGIVHRDIKSSNIIVNSQGHAYILDFGLAVSEGTTRLTVEGGRVGTPAYMSPEQARGREVDGRSDIWSLGVVLFEMLTGRLPFAAPNAAAVVYGIVHEPPLPVQALRPEVSDGLRRVLDRALAKDPSLRWATVRDFGEELRRIRGGSAFEGQTVTLVDAPRSMEKPRSRRVAISSIAALVVLGSAGYYGWNRRIALPAQKRIAVLPFQIIGQDEGLHPIVDGLVEVVTAKLGETQLPEQTLVVPASEIRSRNITSADLANRLYGANLVVAGTVQKLQKKVQFTVTLLSPVNTVQLGARSFDVDSGDSLALRDAALSGILSLLQIHLRRADTGSSGESINPQAYSEYLRGMGYLSRYDKPGNLDLAVISFQNAARVDPNYALAYSGLGRAYTLKGAAKGERHWSDLAIEDAERAVQLAPKLASTHASLGAVYSSFGREDEAIREFQRALQLSPADGEVYRDLAEVLENRGRFTEAEGMFQESVQKRPEDWYGHLLFGLFLERRNRYSEAEAEFRRAVQLTPSNPIALRNIGGLYRIQGRYGAAVEQLQKALAIAPSPSLSSALGVVLYYQHRFPEAAAALEKALDGDSARYIFWGNLGMIYKEIDGKQNEAEHALRRALELGKQVASTSPTDYNSRANLAEYWARLGQKEDAVKELAAIPASVRERFLVRFALVYELTAERQKAISCLLDLPEPTPLNEVKNDPSLQRLWADSGLQQRLRANWPGARILKQ